MRALLDSNVLIALFDADHPHHVWAADWFKANAAAGWASCPQTQSECVRIMSQSGYPNPVPASVMIERLREATADPSHQFWPADIGITDAKAIDASHIHGPRQVSDTYLLALAVRRKGRFVTFDAGIAIKAVRGASASHLLVLGAVAS